MQKKVLCLRLPCEFGVPLKEFAIKESTYSKWSSGGEVPVESGLQVSGGGEGLQLEDGQIWV